MTTETAITVESLTAIGGQEWQKGEMHRVYFNDLSGLYGLKANRYNSGNISSATLDGDKVSNSEARRIESRLDYAKVWFDLADDKFHGKNIEDADLQCIVSAIKRHLASESAS